MRFHMKYRVVQKTGLFSWTTKLRKKYPWKSKRYVKIFRIMSNLTMYFACHCIIYILCLICTNCHVPQNHNDSIMPTLEFHTILIRNAANKTIINTQKDDQSRRNSTCLPFALITITTGLQQEKCQWGGALPNCDDPKYATCHNIKKRHKGTVSNPVKIARTTVFGGGRGAQTFGGGLEPPQSPPSTGYGPASPVFSAAAQSLSSKCHDLTESSSRSERASFPKNT